jgi:hypothetical protein
MDLIGRSRLMSSWKHFFVLWRWQIWEKRDETNVVRTRINVVVFGMRWDIQRPDSTAQFLFLSRKARTVFYFSCMYNKLLSFYPNTTASRRFSCLPYRCQNMGRRYGGIYKRRVSNFGPSALVISKDQRFRFLSSKQTFLTCRIQLMWRNREFMCCLHCVNIFITFSYVYYYY